MLNLDPVGYPSHPDQYVLRVICTHVQVDVGYTCTSINYINHDTIGPVQPLSGIRHRQTRELLTKLNIGPTSFGKGVGIDVAAGQAFSI